MNNKNTLLKWLVIINLVTVISSCHKEDKIEPENNIVTGKLSLHIANNFLITTDNAGGRIAAIQTDDFKVIIFNKSNQEVKVYEKYSQVPAEINLPIGEYYIVAHSNNLVPAAFENPYYMGKSSAIHIIKDSTSACPI